MTILARKFSKIFLLKWTYKSSCVKFNIFLGEMTCLFFLQKEAVGRESVKFFLDIINR